MALSIHLAKWDIISCIRVCCHFSRSLLFATVWTVARQAPLPMGFSRQEYWNWLPYPPLGDLPDPGIEPMSHMSPALADSLPPVPPGKPYNIPW